MGHKLSKREIIQLLGVVGLSAAGDRLLRSRAPVGRDVSDNAAAQRILADGTFPQTGPDEADLSIAIFSDYQCPACRFAEPALMDAVAVDRRVKASFRDWPVFGARSEYAARIALAASYQGKYDALHHLLMIEPGMLDSDAVRRVAERSGVVWPQLEDDLGRHDAMIKAALGRTRWDAFLLGLSGTPSYLIGDLLVVGAQTQEGFGRLFAQARELARHRAR